MRTPLLRRQKSSEQPQVTPADVAAAHHEHMEEPAFRTITSQRQLDTIIAERLKRERAKFADYADLREKAATVDELTTRAEQAERASSRARARGEGARMA